jgi:uncharacterized repeat protein (TIGR01451 family)
VKPSTVYTLTYWLRTQNVNSGPSVYVHQYTNAGTRTGPRLGSYVDVGDGTNGWFRVSLRFQTMPDAHHVRLQLYVWTGITGTFWFDDFALDEGAPALYPFQNGFPVVASNRRVEFSSPAVADIDADGDNELLLGNGGGKVDGWGANGAVLPGFPFETGDKSIYGQLALGDLDGDQDLEIVAGTRASVYGERGRVFVWHHTGAVYAGWPKSVAWLGQYGTAWSEVRSVALVDIDGDSDLEVLAGTTNAAPEYSGPDPPIKLNLYAWHMNGTLVAGEWPTSGAAIYGAIAGGDLTGDGTAEVVTGRDQQVLYAYAGDGNSLPGWPIVTLVDGNHGNWVTDPRLEHPNSAPIIADLDDDGVNEYVVVGNVKHPDDPTVIQNSGLLVLNPDGTRRLGWETAALGDGNPLPKSLPQQAPAVADLNRDGQLEIVVATYDGWIRAYRTDKSILWAVNFTQGDILAASEAVIGDIDGDCAPEIVFGTYDPVGADGTVGLWGLEADGTLIPGFPLAVGTPGIRAAPMLADLDGDGDLEILAAARTGEVFAWDTPVPYTPACQPWPMGRHDLTRSATFDRLKTEPDLSASRKFATRPAPRQGETITYVIRLHNIGTTPLTHTLRLTDVVPAGLTYVHGSLTAPRGVVTDTGGLLQWSGVMSNTRILDVAYDVTVTTGAAELITNTVTIDTVIHGQITRSGAIIANGLPSYLPLVKKRER